MARRLNGKKFAGSHTTSIDAADALLKFIAKQESVEKISLGIIRKCGRSSGQQNIKVKEIPAGLELVVRGNIFAQTIYVYISEPKVNSIIERDKIENFAKENHQTVT